MYVPIGSGLQIVNSGSMFVWQVLLESLYLIVV